MSKPIVFLGSSLQIFEFAEICDLNGQEVAGIVDSDYYGNTADYRGIPYIGSEDTFDFAVASEKYNFFVSSNPVLGIARTIERRQHFVELATRLDLPCANIIDPHCRISKYAKLGQGIYVGYSCNIGYDVVVNNHCILHCQSVVGHGSTIGENSTLQKTVNVTSNVTIGKNVIISVGARLSAFPTMSVGDGAIVQPGLTVHRDIKENEVVKLGGRRVYAAFVDDQNQQ
jgi:acetyltransferase-like isoleucine patch superfamily enzyme